MNKITKAFAAAIVVLTVFGGFIYEADARGGHSSGHSYHSHSSHSRCVGVCYGVRSTVTGRPRNTYVRGYVKKDGTVVQPYTRSK